MGKINQLGDLEEVMALCQVDERFLPCIDFGHLNARTFGSLKTSEDFGKEFERMENCLGSDRMRRFHSHFSKIMKAFWIRQGRTENEKTAFGHSWPQYQSDRDS